MKHFFLIFFAFLLSSCSQNRLTVQTDYLRRENLASYYINTPDPLLNLPLIGQRMIIQWSLPECYSQYSDLHIEATIRFINRTETKVTIPVNELSGMYIYTIHNEDYCEKQGFFTYKAELFGDGCVLDSWRHQLWVELINVGKDCSL